MSRSTPRRGFTIIELIIVLSIVAVLAALALAAASSVIRRGSLATAHKTVASVFEQAKGYALGHANDTIFVIIGNASPANAAACGVGTFSPQLDQRCVRYWLLEDVNTGPGTRWDDNALNNFNPQLLNQVNGVVTMNTGDTLLASGALGRGVMIGTAPGYVPVQPVAGSIYEGITPAAGQPCSFCQPGPPLRGWIRFGANGRVAVGGNPTVAGAFLSFTGVAADGTAIPSTNYVMINAPGGLVTERLSRTGR